VADKYKEDLLVECWVSTANVADVALEVLDVDWVEANDGLRSSESA
jgi:hypothetical protein